MKISGMIIGVLLVSGVIISLYSFAGGLASSQHYNVKINDSWKETFDKINQTQSNTVDLENKIRNVSAREDTGFFTGTWDAFTITRDVIFGAAGTTLSSVEILSTITGSFLLDIGIDSTNHIYRIIGSIITIMVVGALIFLLTKRKY